MEDFELRNDIDVILMLCENKHSERFLQKLFDNFICYNFLLQCKKYKNKTLKKKAAEETKIKNLSCK